MSFRISLPIRHGLVATLLIMAWCGPDLACLRPTLDERAVEWSSIIVEAKLDSVGDAASLYSASTTRPGESYQLYDFVVTDTLDGHAKPGDRIKVIRFFAADAPADNSECGQSLAKDAIGKSFVLLAVPQSELAWRADAADDPRPADFPGRDAFAVVHLESAADMGAGGVADLKGLISDTRRAESQYIATDAATQATTLVNAADDTEADQANHALLEMGPKALPVLTAAMANAGDVGKARLRSVIQDISPPPLSPPAGQP